jgi:tetratricopeptide (TPR) repeat protein
VAEGGPGSAAVRKATSQGFVTGEDVEAGDIDRVRAPLAVAAGADVWLTGELAESDGEAMLCAQVTGTVSGRAVTFEATVATGPDQTAVANELARSAAGMLTPAVWTAVGADAEGRRDAAEQRYAAGQAALATGMYRDAMLEFEAALLGEPDSAEYLLGAAEARVGIGDYSGALVRLRGLAGRMPDDVELALRLGDVALLAGKPEQAEAAFLSAEARRPDDARVVEGIARAARARGDSARAEAYYARLLPMVGVDYRPRSGSPALVQYAEPPLAGAAYTPARHESLPSLLAHRTDDTLRLAGVSAELAPIQIARLYLRAGDMSLGLQALDDYHAGAEAPTYTEAAYLDIFPFLDEESEVIAREVQRVFAARGVGEIDDEEAEPQLDALHDRSDRLAALAEQMQVSPGIDPAHRYRVLAYNMLNQSNFEALMFLHTGDGERRRRADLLRTAFRKSRSQAVGLGEDLLGWEARG